MSDESDSSLARTVMQDSKHENGGIRQTNCLHNQDALYIAQLRYFTAFAAIGEQILFFINGEAFKAIAKRVSLLAVARIWPRNMAGDSVAMAACLNVAERTPENFSGQLPKHRIGGSVMYDFAEVLTETRVNRISPQSSAGVAPKN
jgi:hypothetical protein